MSKRSEIIETILEKKHREYIDDASKADEYMQERSLEEDEEYKILYKSFSDNMYRWILNEQERKRLMLAILIYVYTNRESNAR